MSVFVSKLIWRDVVAHETLAVTLARPPRFAFRPGHYVDVTLPEPPFSDLMGPTRSFSIASPPSAPDLVLVMRMRDSAFKRSLAAMPLGAPVLVDGPIDDLSLALDGRRHVVLLAGGVGIAPFLSAVREAASNGTPFDATLFYSNRRPEDAAYLGELCRLATHVPGLRFIPIMTRLGESAQRWTGETARLGIPVLERHLPALRGPRYYLSGSTTFISGLCQQIERAGVPASDVRVEMYTGY